MPSFEAETIFREMVSNYSEIRADKDDRAATRYLVASLRKFEKLTASIGEHRRLQRSLFEFLLALAQ